MSRQLLLLEVDGTQYGLPTSLVKEVVPAGQMTRLPGAPEHVAGLLNLRGPLITVVDLGRRLRGRRSPADERSTVIVQSEGRHLGLLVDDVHDLQTVDDDGATVPFADAHGGIICDMGQFDGRVVLVIDVAELVRQTLA